MFKNGEEKKKCVTPSLGHFYSFYDTTYNYSDDPLIFDPVRIYEMSAGYQALDKSSPSQRKDFIGDGEAC